jgi:catechol 2,3-dioxygenase-like lactoylglutathione lyase family enzyme
MHRDGWVQVTPSFAVERIDPAVSFYADVLGFEAWRPGGGYAYVERNRVAIRLLERNLYGSDRPGPSHAYVDVLDVDRLFGEIAPRLQALPAERWTPPADQPHGQREFSVRDPDGNLVIFGQGIGANAGQWDYRLRG